MTNFQAVKTTANFQESGDLNELIVLVEELSALISDENALLARGLPASTSQNVVRKATLSAELDAWLARIRNGDDTLTGGDRSLYHALVDRLRQLQSEMTENMSRLCHAMAVTRRRIEAIMSAVREQTNAEGDYNRNGTRLRGEDRAAIGGIYTA